MPEEPGVILQMLAVGLVGLFSGFLGVLLGDWILQRKKRQDILLTRNLLSPIMDRPDYPYDLVLLADAGICINAIYAVEVQAQQRVLHPDVLAEMLYVRDKINERLREEVKKLDERNNGDGKGGIL